MQTLRQSDKCFCQYQFWCKNVNIVQKLWNFVRNVDFFIKCALLEVILIVNSEKNNNLFWKNKFFGYVSFTGKSENLVETAILNDFFLFCSKWSPFSKMLVFKGDIKFS